MAFLVGNIPPAIEVSIPERQVAAAAVRSPRVPQDNKKFVCLASEFTAADIALYMNYGPTFVFDEQVHRNLHFEDFYRDFRYFLIDIDGPHGRLFYSKIPDHLKNEVTVICIAGVLDKWTFSAENAENHWLKEADVIKSKHPKRCAFQDEFELELSTVKIKKVSALWAIVKMILSAFGIKF